MEHLSDAWVDAFDDVVRNHDGLRTATVDHRIVVQYVIDTSTGDPGSRTSSEAAYAVVLDHGDNRVVPGHQPDPDITLRTDRRTAAAIASHAESAQTAFMGGRLRLGGDVRAVIANQDVLAGIDDCAAELRRRTDLPVVEVPDGTALGTADRGTGA